VGFNAPYTYSNGNTVSDFHVRDNLDEAREWFHKVRNSDINSNAIDAEQVHKPDHLYRGLQSGDYRIHMVSGFRCKRSTPGGGHEGAPGHREYVTSHLKGANFTSKSVYFDVPSLGESFTLHRAAFVTVHVSAYPQGNKNAVLTDSGNSNRFYLFVDDTQELETLIYVADYDNGVITGSPQRDSDGSPRWSPFNVTWAGTMAAGDHTIQVKVDPWIEHCHLRNCKLIIDATYYS
jgi:hypothetical protein